MTPARGQRCAYYSATRVAAQGLPAIRRAVLIGQLRLLSRCVAVDAGEYPGQTDDEERDEEHAAQHPDYEMFVTGIHAYRGVSCADCHMPYRSEGGVKFTDHHVQSPLLNIASSCGVCHRWSEAELKARVEANQTKVLNAKLAAEDALVKAHFDVAAAIQAGCTEAQLAGVRKQIRHAQFRWDYVSANNGMGFHSPQETMRILGDSVNGAQEARVGIARLLAGKGISSEPKYPDISSRDKAVEVTKAFIAGKGPRLLD